MRTVFKYGYSIIHISDSIRGRSKTVRTPKLELFVTIANRFQPLTNCHKQLHLRYCSSSRFSSEHYYLVLLSFSLIFTLWLDQDFKLKSVGHYLF